MRWVVHIPVFRATYFYALYLLIAAATFCNAQTPIDTVRVDVQYVDLSPVGNLFLSLKNEATGTEIWQITDSSGQCNFRGVAPGTYRLSTELMSSSQFSNPGIYRRVSRSVTISRSAAGYDAGTDTLSLSPMALEMYSKVITLNLLESSVGGLVGTPQSSYTPVQNAYMYSYSGGAQERNISLITDASGVALVGFDANDTQSYTFTVNRDGYVSLTFTLSAAAVQSSYYVGLRATNASLMVTFKDEAGVPRTIGANEYGSISCYPGNGVGGGYWKSLSSGETGG